MAVIDSQVNDSFEPNSVEVFSDHGEHLRFGGMLHTNVQTLNEPWSQRWGYRHGMAIVMAFRHLDEDCPFLVNEELALQEVSIEVLDERVVALGLVTVGTLSYFDQIPDSVVNIAIVLHFCPIATCPPT